MGEGTSRSPGGHEALIRRFYEQLSQSDFRRARRLITDDYVDHSANLRGLRGAEALAALFDLVRRNFPGLHITLDDIISEGDRVAVRWTLRTMSRAAPAIAHLNGGVTITGISIYRIENGRIVERWTAMSM